MTDWEGLYDGIALSRAFELATARLWERGLISGEMHLGTGEEVVTSAAMSTLTDQDAVATDHRGSPVFVTRRTDLVSLFAEFLGAEDGLCAGRGGHMHLFQRTPLTMSSGIVGAAAPTATGFALAARQLGAGSVAMGFFGDGAVNQGMLLESMNLASAWQLPVVFVCKDNGWAITTRSADVTGGELHARFEGFGLRTQVVDGGDLRDCAATMKDAVAHARRGFPGVVIAQVPRLHGHLLGYKAGRVADHLTSDEATQQLRDSLRAMRGRGGPFLRRAGGLATQVKALMSSRGEQPGGRSDPVLRARRDAAQAGVDVDAIDARAGAAVEEAVRRALSSAGVSDD